MLKTKQKHNVKQSNQQGGRGAEGGAPPLWISSFIIMLYIFSIAYVICYMYIK